MIEITVKQLAAIEQVDERTVRRWIAKGAVEVRRTIGGGIRIIERRSEVRTRAVFFDAGMASTDTGGHSST